MQGIYVNGSRAKSKAEVKRALAEGKTLTLQATSVFGNEYDGDATLAPDGTYFFVGPDPYTDRRFYGQLVVKNGEVKVK